MGHDGLRSRSAKLAAAARRFKSSRSGDAAPFRLVFMSDARRAPQPGPIIRALPPGSAFVYRDYGAPSRRRIGLGLYALCRTRGVHFIDADPSNCAANDGEHLPSWRLKAAQAERFGAGLHTAACHDAEDVARANELPLAAIFLSPVFATDSHPGEGFLGPRRFAELADLSRHPVIALGGVDEANAEQCRGASGLAAIGAFAARKR